MKIRYLRELYDPSIIDGVEIGPVPPVSLENAIKTFLALFFFVFVPPAISLSLVRRVFCSKAPINRPSPARAQLAFGEFQTKFNAPFFSLGVEFGINGLRVYEILNSYQKYIY